VQSILFTIPALFLRKELYIAEPNATSPESYATSSEKQASMHAPRFDTQSKQSSKQPY